MILVDTSVWIDHLRKGNAALGEALDAGVVLTHPFVIGELACGHLRARAEILTLLGRLPGLPSVSHDEALHFVAAQHLHGRGLGWIDIHLLAAAHVARARLWTLDRRLEAARVSLSR